VIQRRQLISLLGGAAAAWPVTARGQQRAKVWRVGVLETQSQRQNTLNLDALKKGLEALGYVEGRNLVVEYRSADGRAERFPELAADLLRRKVDLIVTRGTPAVQAAKNATASIPIVMAASGDPLRAGVVASLARPGGNVTGLSAFTTDLESKRVELLLEIVPRTKRLAALYNMSNPVSQSRWDTLNSIVRRLRIDPLLLDVRTAEDIESAFDRASKQQADALMVENDGLIHANRRSVTGLAIIHKMPAIYATRELVDDGGLLSYSVNYAHLYFRAASFVDKIFKGVAPADLPVEQPTKFDLVINLKAAKAIGLSIPEPFLARADEVIE
jgi:putative ABC transport system substrate-binding protein